MTLDANDGDPVPEILVAIELVDRAIEVARIGLLRNPSAEEERALRKLLLRLGAERAALEADLDAALAGSASVQQPSAAQVAQLEVLLGQAEQATNAALSAAGAIAFASSVLTVASEIAAL